jgi:hypothetical protein
MAGERSHPSSARSGRKVAYTIAVELATKYPRLVFRNPTLLERGWELQRSDRERFVRFFGTDMALIEGTELAERMRQYAAFSRRKVLAELAAQKVRQPRQPPPGRNRLPACVDQVRNRGGDL